MTRQVYVAHAVLERAQVAALRPDGVGFGRIRPDDPGNANYLFEAVDVPRVRSTFLTRRAALPDQKIHRLYRRDQIDQGNTPRCVEGTARHVQLATPTFLRFPKPWGWLYDESKQLDGYPHIEGTDANAMLKVLRREGTVASWWWYYHDQDPELLDRWLLTTGPIMLGAWWTDAMLQTVNSDIESYVEVGDGPFYLGHEVAVLGFRRKDKRTLIVNTWGRTNWGTDGRAWISYEDRAKLFDPHKGYADAVGVVDQRMAA